MKPRHAAQVALLVIVVLCAGTLRAQDAEAPAKEAPIQRLARADGAKLGLDTLVSVNLREMDLAQAVRLLAEEAGINIAMGKDVQGTVTCALNNVSARTALEAFLHANGYEVVGADGVLVVVRPDPRAAAATAAAMAPTRKVRREVFQVPFTGQERDSAVGGGAQIAAREIKPIDAILRSMLSPQGRLAWYERQQIAIVEDDEAHVEFIAQFVKELWATPQQVFIDSKLLEVSLDASEDLGLRWNTFTKVSSHGQRDQNTGVIETRGTGVVSTGPSLGLDRFFSFGIVNANLEIILEAIATDRRVELRSNPRVLVMNHRTAAIVVGQEIPYLSSIESTSADPIRTYAFKEVAVRLEVTPHIADDGMIFMDVHPVVKSVIGYTDEPRQPILSTREAATNVSVANGSTLIIGGLVQRNLSRARSETPYIARIPLIGLLFRQKSDVDVKNDLLFLLSPRIVSPEMMNQMIIENTPVLTAPEPIAVDPAVLAPRRKQ